MIKCYTDSTISQFGHALDPIVCELILANPPLGLFNMRKVDISDEFYCINLNIEDVPKLGKVFPTEPCQ